MQSGPQRESALGDWLSCPSGVGHRLPSSFWSFAPAPQVRAFWYGGTLPPRLCRYTDNEGAPSLSRPAPLFAMRLNIISGTDAPTCQATGARSWLRRKRVPGLRDAPP